MTWDTQNRLCRVATTAATDCGDTGGDPTRFVYDSSGQLLVRTEPSPSGPIKTLYFEGHELRVATTGATPKTATRYHRIGGVTVATAVKPLDGTPATVS